MPDSDALRNYKPQDYPQLEGSSTRYIVTELQRLSASLAITNAVIKKLEARMAAAAI